MKKSNTNDVATHGNGSTNKTNQKQSRKGGKHEVNLRKNGFLNFQIGLIVAMLMVYIGLEASFRMTSGEIPDHKEEMLPPLEYYSELQNFKVEEVKQEVVVSKKKLVDPKIKIVENDVAEAELLKDVIEVPKDSEGDLDVGSINYIAPVEPISKVPFHVIEDVPIFPGCEKVGKDERRACFQKKIQKHVKKNIKYPEAEQELGIKGKVHLVFTIDVDGTITHVEMSGPSKGLEKEAERVIKKLPQMIPGKQRGTPVKVLFSLPIIFK